MFDPKRLFGVTTLDVVRASTFVAEVVKDTTLSPEVVIPVVGGHSGVTIVPLLSQSSHTLPASIGQPGLEALVNRIQFGGDEVVKAKDGAGSATLSMAYAGAEFAGKVIKALKGQKGIVAPSYVHLDADAQGGATIKNEIGKNLTYFSAPVLLGVGHDLMMGRGDFDELPIIHSRQASRRLSHWAPLPTTRRRLSLPQSLTSPTTLPRYVILSTAGWPVD